MDQGNLSQFELGWLVGILEGEGYFAYQGSSGTHRVCVNMTDEDTINQLAALYERILGCGVKVWHKEHPNPNNQDYYMVEIYGERARIIMRLVVRHMSFRRRQRIWQSLNNYKPEKINLVKLLDIRNASNG